MRRSETITHNAAVLAMAPSITPAKAPLLVPADDDDGRITVTLKNHNDNYATSSSHTFVGEEKLPDAYHIEIHS